MMTNEERIREVHRRMAVLKRKRELTRLRAWGGVTALLFACLMAVTVFSFHGHGLIGNSASGTSLLSDAAGGYVLVGVLAFMLGVTVTVILIRSRDRQKKAERKQT